MCVFFLIFQQDSIQCVCWNQTQPTTIQRCWMHQPMQQVASIIMAPVYYRMLLLSPHKCRPHWLRTQLPVTVWMHPVTVPSAQWAPNVCHRCQMANGATLEVIPLKNTTIGKGIQANWYDRIAIDCDRKAKQSKYRLVMLGWGKILK